MLSVLSVVRIRRRVVRVVRGSHFVVVLSVVLEVDLPRKPHRRSTRRLPPAPGKVKNRERSHTIAPMFATLSRARGVLGMAAVSLALAISSSLSARQPAQLKVSENKRFLVTADGQPFFWLGDTAWELFHRPDT